MYCFSVCILFYTWHHNWFFSDLIQTNKPRRVSGSCFTSMTVVLQRPVSTPKRSPSSSSLHSFPLGVATFISLWPWFHLVFSIFLCHTNRLHIRISSLVLPFFPTLQFHLQLQKIRKMYQIRSQTKGHVKYHGMSQVSLFTDPSAHHFYGVIFLYVTLLLLPPDHFPVLGFIKYILSCLMWSYLFLQRQRENAADISKRWYWNMLCRKSNLLLCFLHDAN